MSVHKTLSMKKSALTLFSFLFFLIIIPAGSCQDFQAGAALRIITPDPLLPVSGGIDKPKPVREKKGDLFVRALVLKKGNITVAIVMVQRKFLWRFICITKL